MVEKTSQWQNYQLLGAMFTSPFVYNLPSYTISLRKNLISEIWVITNRFQSYDS